MTGYFVTGTDTNVGKTYVACALARRAVAAGHKVFGFKPIETGCVAGLDDVHVGADQELLATAAGDWQHGSLRGVYRFPLPAAPLVAAEHEGSAIDLDRVVQAARAGSAQASLTIVEGAGGWRVPITATAAMGTLARTLGFPVVVVARASLGTINHTLLTIEAIERDGLPIAGVVLSQLPTDDPVAARSNQAQIQRRWAGSVVLFSTDASKLEPFLPKRST